MGKILSVIPAFELGLWNAWILVLPMLLIFFFAIKVTAARESGEAGDFQLTKKEKRIINAIFLPMIVAFVYAVFLPLQSATAWLISGFVTYLFGIVFIIAAIRNFATSPKNRLVTNGVYRLSRNPMYVGLLLMQIGVGIACSSWLYLLLTVVLMILLNANLSAEERYCLYRYGEDYQKYRDSTPRWIGTPKLNKE